MAGVVDGKVDGGEDGVRVIKDVDKTMGRKGMDRKSLGREMEGGKGAGKGNMGEEVQGLEVYRRLKESVR